MIKMFGRLKNRIGMVLAIVILLFIQANTDLSLPEYTSRIVDVGIQQKGIEDGVPGEMRSETFEQLQLLIQEESDQKQLQESYEKTGDLYTLQEISEEERSELNEILNLPEMILLQMQNQGVDLNQIPKEQIQSIISESEKKTEGLSDSMLSQAAVGFVQMEYTALGKDLDSMQMKYVLGAGLRMLALALIGVLAAISVTFLSCRVAASLSRDLRNEVYRKVISFSNSEMDRFSTASLITRSTNDIQQVQMLFTMLFRIVLYAPILGIGGLLKVLNTRSGMVWVLAVGIGLIGMVILVLMLVAMPRFKKLQILIDKLNLVSREILTGIPVIRAFSREKTEEERFEEANQRLTKTNLFVNRCMTFMMPTMMLIMNGMTVLIVYSGSHNIDKGLIQVGDMMAFIQYAMQIIMSFLMITMISIMLPRASVSAQRINEVLDTVPELRDPENPEMPDPSVTGEVEFRHVSFSYPGAEEEVLHDINFKASKGQTVAFIGSTGSGKSTLVNLIPRFFDVTEGEVRIDGLDVRRMSRKDLRDRLGYVPQKGVLFSGTIASNLSYGKTDATEEELNAAASVAQALEFIEEKEEKMNTPIAQGGTNVSGGQKQRLSIARAIAKNPEIYIFDDSFSALDFKTDAALRKALKEKTKDATTLIVAQRISTILHADQILVLDEGRVVGQGTHKELLKNCEVYRQIATSQLSEEELDHE